jgi:hypothetical protein
MLVSYLASMGVDSAVFHTIQEKLQPTSLRYLRYTSSTLLLVASAMQLAAALPSDSSWNTVTGASADDSNLAYSGIAFAFAALTRIVDTIRLDGDSEVSDVFKDVITPLSLEDEDGRKRPKLVQVAIGSALSLGALLFVVVKDDSTYTKHERSVTIATMIIVALHVLLVVVGLVGFMVFKREEEWIAVTSAPAIRESISSVVLAMLAMLVVGHSEMMIVVALVAYMATDLAGRRLL